MGIFKNFREDYGIVEIVYSDEITEEEIIYDREIGTRMAVKKGAKKFLIDTRFTSSIPSTTALYTHGVSTAGQIEFRSVRIAIVASAVDPDYVFLRQSQRIAGGLLFGALI